MNTKDKILLFAQVAGGLLLPVGVAQDVAMLAKALSDAPGVETDDAQMAALEREYQARIDRRLDESRHDTTGD